MLAVSSLATYGILLAGFLFFHIHLKESTSQDNYIPYKSNKRSRIRLSQSARFIDKQHTGLSVSKRFIHSSSCRHNSNNNNNNNDNFSGNKGLEGVNKDNCSDLKTSYSHLVQSLFKDRNIPAIPYDPNLAKASCFNYTNQSLKEEFLK